MKPLPDPPPGNRLAGFSGDGRLLIEIAAGSSSTIRFLGFCAVGGMAFVAYFLWQALNAPGGPAIGDAGTLGTAMFLFLPILGGWIYARFGRTCVRVEAGWLEVEKSLLGIAWRKEYTLGLDSRATLIATHMMSQELQYAVRVSAVGEQPVFGRWLFQLEQEWIVQQINHHLKNSDWEEVIVDENTELEYTVMDGFQWGE